MILVYNISKHIIGKIINPDKTILSKINEGMKITFDRI